MIELDREKRDEIVKRRKAESWNSITTSDPETSGSESSRRR